LKVRLCKKINNYVNAELCLKFNYWQQNYGKFRTTGVKQDWLPWIHRNVRTLHFNYNVGLWIKPV
jgi:hypothetical protein